MKKFIPILLFCALYMPLSAQEQEDVVVRRGHYKPAVTDTIREQRKPKEKRWFNMLTVSLSLHDNDKYESGFVNNTYGYQHDQDYQLPLAIGYMRLYNYKNILFGPGLHIKYDFDNETPGVDVFLHGRYNLKNILGTRKVNPHIGISIGAQKVNDIWFYLDYSTGISISINNNYELGISYFGMLLAGEKQFYGSYRNGTEQGIVLCHGGEISFRF